MADERRVTVAEEDVLAAAVTLVALTSERAIRRTDQVGDRIVVPRSALLALRDAIERAYPGGEAAARRILTNKRAALAAR